MATICATYRTAGRTLKHPCYACGLPIIKNDSYVVTSQAIDGHVFSFNEHFECTVALKPHIVRDDEESQSSSAYLINYYDTDHETTEAWRTWYQARKAAP